MPSVPPHVPEHLVTHVDPIVESLRQPDPMTWFSELAQKRPILYNAAADYPAWKGEWFFFGMEPLREILENAKLYSTDQTVGAFEMVGVEGKLLPLEADPPTHGLYRSIIGPALMPNRIAKLEDAIRAQANELIDQFADQFECEFNEAFAAHFPVRVFMRLMGFPPEDQARMTAWERQILYSLDPEVREGAAKQIYAYLKDLMVKKQANPGDDLASIIVSAEIEDRKVSEREIMGMYFLMFLAGLHTVTASLTLMFRCLAENPALQDELRAEPARINRAIDEFLRFNSIIIAARRVMVDHEYLGVTLRKGDVIRCVTVTASRDPAAFHDPQELVLNRSPNRHLAFGAGHHLCAGFPLARLEMRTALTTWLQRMPNFRRKEGSTLSFHGIGGGFGLDHLHLEWGR